MSITVNNICKTFGSYVALDNVSIDVQKGELMALLGPSGSGKTTLLRVVAGLETPNAGDVVINGETAKNQSARERHIGFVFQHYALFRHMTVFDNVAFGLKVRDKDKRLSKEEIKERVHELLGLVHLDSFHHRYPAQLSGGQRQRVALARALAVRPSVLLLDEPFSALDAKVRKELRHWLRRLHEEMQITIILVTHDQEEAMEVADRVVVMSQGRVEQMGTPEEVWQNPCNAFVYDFLGNYNEFEGWRDSDGTVHLTEYDVQMITPDAPVQRRHRSVIGRMLSQPTLPYQPKARRKVKRLDGDGQPVKLYARPHEMDVAREPDDGEEYIVAMVMHVNPAGALVKYELERRNGSLLQAAISRELAEELAIKKGEEIMVRPKKFRVFD